MCGGVRHARADDEHVLTPVGLRVVVGGGVNQLAIEALQSRPVGHVGVVVEADRDHDRVSLDGVAVRLDAPGAVGAIHPTDPSVSKRTSNLWWAE